MKDWITQKEGWEIRTVPKYNLMDTTWEIDPALQFTTGKPAAERLHLGPSWGGQAGVNLVTICHHAKLLQYDWLYSSSPVWMWGLDHKESWAPKNWWFWTVVLEKTLQSPLDCKEIQPVNPKGNQPWIFIGRIDAEAETPMLWLPDVKNWLRIRKRPWCLIDWRQEEKGMTEDEMVGRQHQLDGHEFEQARGVGDEQGNLACCSPWGCKESDTTEWLNWLTIFAM